MLTYRAEPGEAFVLFEQVDYSALYWLMCHSVKELALLLAKSDSDEKFDPALDIITPEQEQNASIWKQTLLNYYHDLSVGMNLPENIAGHLVVYHQSRSNPHRRFAEIMRMSLQGLPRAFRHSISKGIYIDVDIANAHPSILAQFCVDQGVECERLRQYVSNRGAVLDVIADMLGITKGEAKQLILRCMNGGSPSPAQKDILAMPGFSHADNAKWFELFMDEMQHIRKEISTKFPKLLERASARPGKDSNHEAAALSYFLGNLENQILESAYKFCLESHVQVGALCFDGLMVSKEIEDIDKFLADLAQWVHLHTGFNLQFVVKPMNQGASKPNDFIVPVCQRPIGLVHVELDPAKMGKELVESASPSALDVHCMSTAYEAFRKNRYLFDAQSRKWYSLGNNMLWTCGERPVDIISDMTICIKTFIERFRDSLNKSIRDAKGLISFLNCRR